MIEKDPQENIKTCIDREPNEEIARDAEAELTALTSERNQLWNALELISISTDFEHCNYCCRVKNIALNALTVKAKSIECPSCGKPAPAKGQCTNCGHVEGEKWSENG